MPHFSVRPRLRMGPAPLCANTSPSSTALPYRVGILSQSYNVASDSFRRLTQAAPPVSGWTAHRNTHQYFSTGSRLAERKHTEARVEIVTSRGTQYYKRRAGPSRSEADTMNAEQSTIYNLIIKKRQNVFFTGPAGTGKSWLLKRIIRDLRRNSNVAVTASTGLASCSIGGATLHSFARIGLGQAPTERLILEIESNEFKRTAWKDVQVLIIDEVSMIDSTLFDKLDSIARKIREDDRPFGGIQLVITGDFFQLPPVLEGQDDGAPRFCFEAKAWKGAVPHTISLTHIYRQGDPTFRNMLNEIREGLVSPSTIDRLRKLSRPLSGLTPDNEIEATELFPLRCQADLANSRRLQNITSPMATYVANHAGKIQDTTARMYLLKNCIAPEVLELKTGAQVMLLKNIDATLVNGSQGVVVGFANRHTFRPDAWGRVNLSQLSANASSLIKGEVPFEGPLLFPVVRFRLKGGGTQTILCTPMSWDVERWIRDPNARGGWRAEILATRIQVPLVLAWALSIHKAQGQTLSLVKVDLGSVFERGQAYVALSRATSMDGLQVLNFDPVKVAAHPRVKTFYAGLSTARVTGARTR